MRRRTLPLLTAVLILILPTTIAAYDLSRPEAKMLAGELTVVGTALPPRPLAGLALRGWDGGAWQPPPATHVVMRLFNVNSRELRDFEVSPEGKPYGDPKLLEHFFRCKRSGRSHEMAPGVIAVLADVARNWPGKTIEIVSGFRRRGTGVRRSKHYIGNAIDFRVRGVPVADVRDFIWTRHSHIGLGHYHGGGYLHIDYRPHEPKIGWNQYHNGGHYRYHPSWSK